MHIIKSVRIPIAAEPKIIAVLNPSVVKKSLDIDYKRPRVAEDENLGQFEKQILAALRHQGPK